MARIGTVLAAAVLTFLGLFWVLGGFKSPASQYPTCVDQNGRVVAQSNCNTQQAGNPALAYYIVMATRTYRTGQEVPSNVTRIPADDQQARANAGLPKTGEVPEHIQAPEPAAPEAPGGGVHEAPAPAVHEAPPVEAPHVTIVDP